MSTQITVEQKFMSVFELEGVKSQLSNLLENNEPKMEAFKTRILQMSLSQGLKGCSPESIIKCGLQALTLRLPLEAGQGYIVKYGGSASFDCGYKGWQILAKRAGYSVLADVVYNCDDFMQKGFGHNRDIHFEPDFKKRQGSNDKWAKENLTGVIVSILDHKTNFETYSFITADMIFKITGMSPSQKSEKGKIFSPHENWAEQMFCAKAIKQVLSKYAIDLDEASELHQAIDIINTTEVKAQKLITSKVYSDIKFNETYPKWAKLVSDGDKSAMSIISFMNSSWDLTTEQLNKLQELKKLEPIEGETK